MARTFRRVPTYWLRRPKTTNSRRGEHTTCRDMLDEEYFVSNRIKARGNLSSRKIPNSWDDINVASLQEFVTRKYRYLGYAPWQRNQIGRKIRFILPKGWFVWGNLVLPSERGSGRNI